ncbi:biliverdin-producing heme oxygenase [Pseudoxanthomonas winnipegensis]|jgi:heme oxygenase|uniref:Biliverdin-producing heme oxygenase n=1 Tax=Pseudoxanthomonas winnipegensis TaxID=2480810 RepID=A0A4Q8LAU0_9GAMM|nr:biliverdin-producing heme oxygenase [Pseudoxanthomonas winnipegensis]TAA25773.1 biliverdin-producing heme oxygenase [Pseudoxanthomonas winnipegensis]
MPADAAHAPPPLARALREATAQAHAAVEALPHMHALARGILPPDQYVRVLQRHLALVEPWERTHAAWLATLAAPGWRYRARGPALRADLVALGAAAPPVAPLAEPEPAAAAWGQLYVIEGSLLGGRLIARAFRTAQPALAAALAYFDLGSDAPGAWRQFQACLEAALPSDPQRQAAIGGAQAMFSRFHQQLATQVSA